MNVTKDEFEDLQDDLAGYCTECQAVTTEEVDPDSEDQECQECGSETCVGIDQALVLGLIQIVDDGDEDLDVNLISISNE